jgi:large subunit ribosomal protein L29
MEMDKIVNLDAEELALASRQAAEQIFRLRFQLSMGQSEGVKKLRELKKDIARIRTVERQRELGITAPAAEAKPKRAKKPAKVKSKAKTGRSAKPAARGATSAAKRASARKSGRKGSQSAGRANPASRSRSRAAGRGNANSKKGS